MSMHGEGAEIDRGTTRFPTGTRTYVTYFSSESLQELQNVYDQLCQDWARRSEAVSQEAQHAGNVRLEQLGNALILLREPVPGPFGG